MTSEWYTSLYLYPQIQASGTSVSVLISASIADINTDSHYFNLWRQLKYGRAVCHDL